MDTLPAGVYWIGDPCYVLGDKSEIFDWDKFCSHCFAGDPSGRKNEGIVNHQGITFAHFGTAYGDGCYSDQNGNEYGVDAGLLACIPLGSLLFSSVDELQLGATHTFPKPFSVSYEDGTITFGHVVIKTGDDQDEEYDDEFQRDEENEDDEDREEND